MSDYGECCIGQSSLPRRKVENIGELKEGDHVCFQVLTVSPVSNMAWHHAIVEKVDPKQEETTVIHYTKRLSNDNNSSGKVMSELSKAEVKRSVIPFIARPIYRITGHNPLKCFPPKEVLVRARSKLGERNYNLITNNCEHFAMWCKTGDKTCNQLKTFGKQTAKTTIQAAAHHATMKALGEQTGVALDAAIVGTVALLSEVTLALIDNHAAKAKLVAGEISRQEYNNMVRKRVKTGTCNVTGSVVGCVMGQLVTPGFGGTIGVALGSTGATILGYVILK